MKNMKKILLSICCFGFLFSNVSAASDACNYHVGYVTNDATINITDQTYGEELVREEGELVHTYEEYVKLLHNTGWNTYAYKCVVEGGSCTKQNTECEFDSATVATWQCYKTQSSTCTSMFTGTKGYGYSVTSNCSKRIPVPCDEPPAILCKADCSVSNCSNPEWVDGYCGDGTGTTKETCSDWVDGYTRNLWDASYEVSCGGGSTDTVTEAECKKKLEDYECKSDPSCELFYRSEYMVCEPSDCNHVKFMVKGAHDFVYAVNTGSGGPAVTAYCANPSHNPLLEKNSARSEEIDIMKCAASDSSLDCGVANIMSEAYYRNQKVSSESGIYNAHVVSLAIRMWYAYKDQSGFDTMGIAEEDETTISSIDAFLPFLPGDDGKYPNVYKNTLDGIRRNLFFQNFSDATQDYNFEGATISNLVEIACSDSRLTPGVYCNGSSGDTYKYAAYLFINTVQGNPYMKEHFQTVFGGVSTELEGEELVAEVSKLYNDPIFYQVSLSEDRKTVTLSYELRETVNISCNSEHNPDGCDTPDQKLIFKDVNGNVIETILVEKYDYCNKNFCTVVVELEEPTVECTEISKTELTFTGKKVCGSSAIRKYIPCLGLDDYQIMYSFEATDCNPDLTDNITLTSSIECPGGCREESLAEPISTNCTKIYEYDAENNNNGSGYYFNENVAKENQVGVKYEINKDYVKYNISDPSLNCILHKNSNTRDYYDYSSYFGVNTNFCRVYCSDSVEYYLPPRTTVSNSLQLKYDVNPSGRYDDNALISNVKTRRNCVSKIFYDDFSFSGSKVDWNAAYGLDSSLQINNWKELYNAVYELSKTQGNKKDFLHNLVYDLYNCNFFTDNEIKIAGVIKPADVNKNSRTYVSEYLNNTKTYCNDKDCTSGETKFQGGADYIDPTLDRVGGNYQNFGHPELSDNSTVKNSITFKYCKTTDKCFEKDTNPNAVRPYEDTFTTKAKTVSYMADISGLNGVEIPVNDYVIFSYEAEGKVYNDTSYQVEPQTGKVQEYVSADSSKYNKIAENTFPISYYSDALCNFDALTDTDNDKDIDDDDKKVRYCNIDVNVKNHIYTSYNNSIDKNKDDNINAFYRKTIDDAFIKSIIRASNYTCQFIIADDPVETPIGFVFRNIDLASPVPTDTGDRNNSTVFKNSNWDLSNSDKDYQSHLEGVIDRIKESSDKLYGRDEYLEYSYILDDFSIRKIREYNDVNKDYSSTTDSTGVKTLNSCNKSGDGKYFDCQSTFLEQLNTFDVKVIKDDGLSLHTKCEDNPSGEGCVD